jgi:hypothetical protein
LEIIFFLCSPTSDEALDANDQRIEHIEADGATVFLHACRLGCEGIVSKRRDAPTVLRDFPHRCHRGWSCGDPPPSLTRI